MSGISEKVYIYACVVYYKRDNIRENVPFSSFVSYNMSSAYGKIPKPVSDGTLNESLPLRKTLRNGQEATLQAVDPTNPDLVKHLHSLFNGELERG